MSKKTPQIRFKGFTDDWEERKFADFIDVKSGKDYKHLNSGSIPVYGTGGYMLSVDRALSDIDAIGIGRKGTIDKPYLLKAPFWTVDTLFYAVPKQNIDLQFSLSIFKKINWKKFDESTGVPSLSKTVINSVGASVPSYEEQQKIGSFFQQLDETIALHQRKLDLLKEQKKGFLQKMFPKNGAKVPELRFEGFSDDWEERKLGDVGDTFTGLTGKTKEDFGHGSAKFVTYVNVFQNPIATLDQLDAVEIDEKQNQVQKGDVFFTTSSETPEEVGMSSVWTYDTKNVYLNSFTFGYRPRVSFDLNYMASMLRSPSIRKKITFLAQGISRYNISKTKMLEIEIPAPNLSEQKKIGSFFKQLDDTIALHQRKLDLLKEQKKGFLQKMFVS
ncbi:Type I restriction-modification system, specificity subunit S [Leuconostoc pseudomesenteroides 1159]|nr:Type I restriction-modification system, specificity subunit S [Leuconostoc pseudomesenteroides 1159]